MTGRDVNEAGLLPLPGDWLVTPNFRTALWAAGSEGFREVIRVSTWTNDADRILRIECELSDDPLSELADASDEWDYSINVPAGALPGLAFLIETIAAKRPQ